MRKKIFTHGRHGIIFLLLFTLLFSAMPAVPAVRAETLAEYPADGYEYVEKADGTLQLTNLIEGKIPDGDYIMRIPETIDGKTVTELGRFGNYRCAGTGLVEVILPKTVTRIGGDHANSPFQDCDKLKKVTLYDSFEVFGYQAFMNCTELEKIEVRSSATDAPIAQWPESFQKMPKLKEIDKGAFDDCKKLSCPVLVLPDHVKTLGSQPFDGVTFSTMYLMNPDPSGYNENFLFPNTRTDFVAICTGRDAYQAYYDHIHPEEYGNMYTRFLTYEMDVSYDKNESKPGGVKRSLWNQVLRYTEKTPSDPYSVWEKDPGYKMLDPGLTPKAGHQYFWFWDAAGKKGPVTPDCLVKSDRLYASEKPLEPVVTVDSIDEVYTGEKFPLKIHATSPLVNEDVDLENPNDGDCAFFYIVVNWSSKKVVYKGEDPNGFTVKNVNDSQTYPHTPGYLVFVCIEQYHNDTDKWDTIYEPDYISYNYENASAEVQIRPADPVINPVAQSPVPSGTLLKDISLSPQSGDTPGTLTWSNPDTAVAAGEHTYDWTFTPADTDNYNHPVTGTLAITGLDPSGFWTVRLHNDGSIRNIPVLKGNSLNLPSPGEKTDHFFEGWTTEESGKGTKYENLATLTPESDMDLYAQWTEGCTVTYVIGDEATWETLPAWIKKTADGKYQHFVKKNDYLKKPVPAPSRDGYGLTSWKYRTYIGSNYFDQDFYFDDNPWMKNPVTGNMTLTAQWNPTRTVTFDANGGSGTMEPATVSEGQYILPKTADFVRAGYSFDGWSLKADGEKISNTYIMISADTTLYAHWVPKSDTPYKVEHYLQNIDGTWDDVPNETETPTGTTGDLTQAEAKEFDGFTAQPVTQETISGDGTSIIKIRYQRHHYKVHFDSNGGTGVTDDQNFAYGEEKALTQNGFSRTGHSFSGWNTSADGTGTDYKNAQTVKNLTTEDNGVLTLYAMWKYRTPAVDPPSPDLPDEPDQPDLPDQRPPALEKEDHFDYFHGYPDATFGPARNMTRAEVAQMFCNLLVNKDVPYISRFEDVPEDAWYSEAINKLAALGIVKGVDTAHYEPDRTVTRAEFTVTAMRFTESKTTASNIFSDISENDWFFDQVLGAVHEGWILGYEDGTFRPYQTITRAEVTAITNRMLERSADVQYVDTHTDTLKTFPDVKSESWYYYDVMEASNSHRYVKEHNKERWITD